MDSETYLKTKSSSTYIGLGSNLGDRAAHLWRGLQLLSDLPGARIERISPLYESEPVGPVAQGRFLNAVVAFLTELGPLDLLRAMKGIEAAVGRVPAERWGPRVIDLDLLLFAGTTLESVELTLPHPELWNRRFVLCPLLDVAREEDLRDRIAQRLSALDGADSVRPYASVGQQIESA